MQTKPRIFFTAHDLWKIPDFAHLSRGGIYARYRKMKLYFNKEERRKQLTFLEAAEYFDLEEDFLRAICQ